MFMDTCNHDLKNCGSQEKMLVDNKKYLPCPPSPKAVKVYYELVCSENDDC